MKISCEIIKDLLPLYYDNVCSTESKLMVDEHLKDCDNCKKELELIGDTFSISSKQQNFDNANNIKKLSKKWRRGMLKSIFKGIAITIITIIILFLILSIFIEFKIVI